MWTQRLGWWTSNITRPKLILRGVHAITSKGLIVNSSHCLNEMGQFESDHNIAKARARSGHHDDRVMALLIGYWGLHDDEWLAGEDITRERLTSSRMKDDDGAESGPRRDFQNTDASNLYKRSLAATCANCHGTDGKGVVDGGMPLINTLTSEQMLIQLKAFKSGAREGTIMPQLAKGYSDEQLETIANQLGKK